MGCRILRSPKVSLVITELAFNDLIMHSLKPLKVCYGYRWESATLFSLAFGGVCYFGR